MNVPEITPFDKLTFCADCELAEVHEDQTFCEHCLALIEADLHADVEGYEVAA